MIKKSLTLVLLFSTVIINSQNITLLKNFNPKVKELKHNLNTTNDSLLMQCDKKIYQVEIFNEDYEKVVIVEDTKAQISLDEIPVGSFVVEAKLEDKIVVMTIIKYSNIKEVDNEKTVSTNSIEFLLSNGSSRKNKGKTQKLYWTLTEVNTGSSTSKTMKLVSQESVERMISKNKLEQNSTGGKLNELTVWEVYNSSKFMKQQVSNADFMYSQSSNVFNTKPYYTTKNSMPNSSS